MAPGIPRYSTESERMRGKAADCDEVFPGIIVGTGRTAKNLAYLNKLGVTHVINAAENDVHLNPAKLRKEGIAYKGFRYKQYGDFYLKRVGSLILSIYFRIWLSL